jgi:hypothetical protein
VCAFFAGPQSRGKRLVPFFSGKKPGQNNVVGGKACDVLHLTRAKKSNADRIDTLNVRDFTQPAGQLTGNIGAF